MSDLPGDGPGDPPEDATAVEPPSAIEAPDAASVESENPRGANRRKARAARLTPAELRKIAAKDAAAKWNSLPKKSI